MLKLVVAEGQKIQIGSSVVEIKKVRTNARKVELLIAAPPDVPINCVSLKIENPTLKLHETGHRAA